MSLALYLATVGQAKTIAPRKLIDKHTLFDEVKPFNSGMLAVSKIHTLYYEESGNPEGIPVVFLHGGPGAGITPKHHRYFDPKKFRAILFDQRGCGKSTPRNALEENTTRELVADLEKLRKALGVKCWVVVGSSWGSTLALAYAQEYPAHVLGMVLRSVFLATEEQRDWAFHQKGSAKFFPAEYAELIGRIPENEHRDLLDAFLYRLKSSPKNEAIDIAKILLEWEYKISTMEAARLAEDTTPDEDDEGNNAFAYTHSLLELHYAKNYFFLEDQQLVSNISRIAHIPSVIIHGRYDLVCPLKGAWDLHKAWPDSHLIIDPIAGHSGGDLTEYVVGALTYFSQRIKKC